MSDVTSDLPTLRRDTLLPAVWTFLPNRSSLERSGVVPCLREQVYYIILSRQFLSFLVRWILGSFSCSENNFSADSPIGCIIIVMKDLRKIIVWFFVCLFLAAYAKSSGMTPGQIGSIDNGAVLGQQQFRQIR